ncbi:O-antigen polymerase [Caulobacter sp. DWR1-3-2b1]|uniref:O-antigen polymerase n=1 Tax=Caulobacter sp. DWR1-3-2b1 TaxID=2804670 RepID=UPI003CF04381
MGISLLWIVVTVGARYSERTWLGPASLLSLIFSSSYIGTVIFAPEYRMPAPPNIFLALIVSVMIPGSLLGQGLARAASFKKARLVDLNFDIRLLFVFGMACSLLGFVVLLVTLGISPITLFDPRTFMRLAQTITFNRYTSGLNLPLSYNILNAGFLAYMIVLGFHLGVKKSTRFRMFIPFIIFALGNILITTRAPILFCGLIFSFSYVYGIHVSSGIYQKLFTRRSIVIGSLAATAVALLFFSVQVMRFGEQSHRSAGDVWAHLRRWPWGSLPGFSHWYQYIQYASVDQPFGYFTFTGVLDNLGIAQRVKGAYSEYIMLAPGEPGNIFTAFRGLITDFGPYGTGVFIFILAVLGAYALEAGRKGSIALLPVYVGVMCFVGWSFVYSFFAYTSHLLALMGAPLLIYAVTVRGVSSTSG